LPFSAVQTFLEPGEAEAAYFAADVKLTPIGNAAFRTRVVRVGLENLWVSHVHENAPRVKHAVQSPDRAVIKFLASPGQKLLTQGIALPDEAVLCHSRAHSYYDRTSGPTQWAGMSLPVEQLAASGMSHAGRDVTPERDLSVVIPPPNAMKMLRRRHQEIVAVAKVAPCVLAVPEVAHAMEQSLIEAWVLCLSQSGIQQTRWAQQSHGMIMHRFYSLLEDNPGRPIYVPEICAAIRVPERTLRLCCSEHIGMAPARYLLLRRMHQARRTLSSTASADATVTEIATQYGFWHFGRFSGNYQSLFGESPSVTLQRSRH
jgi:AraC-like DNA-binding protein